MTFSDDVKSGYVFQEAWAAPNVLDHPDHDEPMPMVAMKIKAILVLEGLNALTTDTTPEPEMITVTMHVGEAARLGSALILAGMEAEAQADE